jgi:hypothetical protein
MLGGVLRLNSRTPCRSSSREMALPIAEEDKRSSPAGVCEATKLCRAYERPQGAARVVEGVHIFMAQSSSTSRPTEIDRGQPSACGIRRTA